MPRMEITEQTTLASASDLDLGLYLVNGASGQLRGQVCQELERRQQHIDLEYYARSLDGLEWDQLLTALVGVSIAYGEDGGEPMLLNQKIEMIKDEIKKRSFE